MYPHEHKNEQINKPFYMHMQRRFSTSRCTKSWHVVGTHIPGELLLAYEDLPSSGSSVCSGHGADVEHRVRHPFQDLKREATMG